MKFAELKYIAKNTFLLLKFNELNRMFNASPLILFWHGVDYVKNPLIEPENVDVSVYVEQIKYLKKRYEIVAMEEFYQRGKNEELKGDEVVLTFDDGYRDHYSVLAPIMYDFCLPFTIFITTNNIETGDFFATSLIRLAVFDTSLKEIDIPTVKYNRRIATLEQKRAVVDGLGEMVKTEPLAMVRRICSDIIHCIPTDEYEELKNKYTSLLPLRWSEVTGLNKDLCTIGSHGAEHICCHSRQEKTEVEKQIFESKKIIESKTGIECGYFAYPNGDHTEFSDQCVHDAGYKLGFLAKQHRGHFNNLNRAAMPRRNAGINLDNFKMLF